MPPGTSFGAAPYRALPPELLYLDEGGVERELASRTRLEFSHLARRRGRPPGSPGRGSGRSCVADFAPERANRSLNLFDASWPISMSWSPPASGR